MSMGTAVGCYDMYGKCLLGLEEKYPHLVSPNAIAEEYISIAVASTHWIEFCIQDGKLFCAIQFCFS